MRAFIIRPFADPFPNVEKVLIDPALTHHQIVDRTTLDITQAGNIRVDMFQRLLTADLVIADLSIHNANVFYELGIRHSLRQRHTVMIRSEIDKLPFDLFTDRYFLYDKDDPAAALPGLITFIGDSLRAVKVTDSPVFQLLPKLVEQTPEVFLPVRPEFGEAVEQGQAGSAGDEDADRIADLALLASEVDRVPWRIAGLRAVGKALFDLKANEATALTLEKIRDADPDDVESNTLLATTYQRMRQPVLSDQALDRVLDRDDIPPGPRSEALALRARNAKDRWIQHWKQGADLAAMQKRAIASKELLAAYDDYHDAFLTDLTNYYPGVNAVGMLLLITELAKAQPAAWTNSRKNPREAQRALEEYEERMVPLAAAVEISVDAAIRRAKERDIWAEISGADLAFYRNSGLDRTCTAYEGLGALKPFHGGSIRGQLQMFVDIGVLSDVAVAVQNVMPKPDDKPTPHHVLFTGHRIDDPGRAKPRFPPAKEGDVAREIAAKLDEIHAKHPNLIGISGAASGGDILFHEACIARGIPSVVYLAMPREAYAVQSVASAGANWLQRFHAVLEQRHYRVMQGGGKLPVWLADRDENYIWQRSNLWMLNRALVGGGQNMTMLALWNGQAGDGPGGTADMIDQATRRGATVIRVGQELFA